MVEWVRAVIGEIGFLGDPDRHLSFAKIDSLAKPGHSLTGVFQTACYRQSLLGFCPWTGVGNQILKLLAMAFSSVAICCRSAALTLI